MDVIIRRVRKFCLFVMKKNENFKMILTGLIILLGASALVYVGNNCIPIYLQLPPQIWGTVSDWVTIILALVTAVFLYKTLRSQQEVQRLQEIQTRVNLNEKMYSFRPKITVDLDKSNGGGIIRSTQNFSTVQFTFVVRNIGRGEITRVEIPDAEIIIPNSNVIIPKSAYQMFMANIPLAGVKPNQITERTLQIRFNDTFGNIYSQKIVYRFKMEVSSKNTASFTSTMVSILGGMELTKDIME